MNIHFTVSQIRIEIISSFLFLFEKINRYNDPMIKQVINDTKAIQADLLEISLLETLILCRKGMQHVTFAIRSSLKFN